MWLVIRLDLQNALPILSSTNQSKPGACITNLHGLVTYGRWEKQFYNCILFNSFTRSRSAYYAQLLIIDPKTFIAPAHGDWEEREKWTKIAKLMWVGVIPDTINPVGKLANRCRLNGDDSSVINLPLAGWLNWMSTPVMKSLIRHRNSHGHFEYAG